MKSIFIIFACTSVFIQCANILEPLSPKDTDNALLYEAKLQIDNRDFIAALDSFADMSSSFKDRNEVRLVHASALAGACGMEFIPFFTSLSNANFDPPNTFFKFLRNSFTDKSTTPSYCVEAEAKIKQIGATEAARLVAMDGNKEVNMLMAILAMAKVGGILRTTSDTDGANSLGDGSTDAGFDACSDVSISDDNVLEVATGFKLITENLSSILGAGSSTQTILDGVAAVISPLCNLPDNTKCSILDRSEIADGAQESEIINTYRDLLALQDFGIGACQLPTLPDDCCP